MKTIENILSKSEQIFKNQLKILAIYEEKCVGAKVVNYGYDKSRNAVSIHFVLSGKGTLYIKGKEFIVDRRQSFFVPAFEEVKYISDIKDPWHYVWIEIKGEYALRIAKYIGFSLDNPVITPQSSDIQTIFFTMLHRKLTHDMDNLEFYSDLFLLIKALKDVKTNTQSLIDNHIQDALTYIHNNYMNNIALADIARNASLNGRYLSKIFQDEMGETPIRYLNNLRLRKAKALLEKTTLSIGEIATLTGFLDPLYFSKVFRANYKISPRAFRKNIATN